MECTIKVVTVSVGSVKGYSRHEVRVVECRKDQAGYKSELGVKTLWNSGPEAIRTAKQIAAIKLLETLNV